MLLRILSLFLILSTCTSCDFFSGKKSSQFQELDTIIDFSSVDASPSFENCADLIDKIAKKDCFRKTMHTYIASSLRGHTFKVRAPIEEVITVTVRIDVLGEVTVKHIDASEQLKKTMKALDRIIHESIAEVPRLFPALKRGIPVATQYQIPIEIRVNKK